MEDFDLVRGIRNKEEKSEMEHVLLKFYYSLAMISEILVEESKLHISSEDAISKIRENLQSNL